MSGTSNPLYVAPPDPLGALLKFAQGQQAQAGIGQTQAQTGLLGAQTEVAGQQAVAAQIANQKNQALLGLFTGAMGGGQGGMPGAGGSALPGGAPGGSALPGGLPPGVTPPQQASTSGAISTSFGPPISPIQYATAVSAAMSGGDFNGSIAKAVQTNMGIVASQLGAASVGLNDSDPAVRAAAQQRVQQTAFGLHQQKILGDAGFAAIMKDPGSAIGVMNAQASPDSALNARLRAATEGMTLNASGQYGPDVGAIGAQTTLASGKAVAGRTGETMDVTVPGPGGTKVTVKGTVMPDGSVVGLNGQPLRGAIPVAGGTGPGAAPPTSALIAPGATMSPEAWAAKNFKSEGGTAPDAGGGAAVGGFLPATFLETMKSSQPDLVAGKTDAQILAMRSDPNIVQQASIAYARANAPQLQAAGINPDASALRLAHWFGPTGAAAVLHAPQGTPLGQIISPTTLAANGLSPQMTSNQLLGRVVADYGTAAVPGITPGAVAPTAAVAPPAAAGIGTSAPQWTPQQQAAVDVDKGRLAEDQKLVAETQTGAMKAQASQPTILDLRQRAAADPAAFGAAGDLRTSIGNALATFGPEWTQNFTKWMTDNKIDPSTAGGRQAMGKEFFNMVTGAESQLPNTRIGAMLTQYFSKAMPNINMQGDAVKEMLNFALVGNQMARDYAQGASGHFNAANAAFPAQDPLAQRYAPLTQFDEKWTAPGAVSSPNVYEAASNILNGRTYDVWSKGLTRAQAADQQAEALKIALRADPSFKIGTGQLPPRPVAAPAAVPTQQAAGP